jgi:hypothetical protein
MSRMESFLGDIEGAMKYWLDCHLAAPKLAAWPDVVAARVAVI